jgi:chromosome segregation ATPase
MFPEVNFDEEAGMSAPGREAVLARLQARQKELQRELARLERQIVRAERQVVAVERRIARLAQTQRMAA